MRAVLMKHLQAYQIFVERKKTHREEGERKRERKFALLAAFNHYSTLWWTKPFSKWEAWWTELEIVMERLTRRLFTNAEKWQKKSCMSTVEWRKRQRWNAPAHGILNISILMMIQAADFREHRKRNAKCNNRSIPNKKQRKHIIIYGRVIEHTLNAHTHTHTRNASKESKRIERRATTKKNNKLKYQEKEFAHKTCSFVAL